MKLLNAGIIHTQLQIFALLASKEVSLIPFPNNAIQIHLHTTQLQSLIAIAIMKAMDN